MVSPPASTIPPVFILSTGRCGSTMVSNILNRHPQVLSLSEFISYIGIRSLSRRRPTGAWMWDRYSRQQPRTRLMLRGRYEELLYPLDDPNARCTQDDVPPILCATLPHLTERYEELYDELGPVVRSQPKQPPADHFRHLFAWLCEQFGCCTWAERSGGSLLFASRLLLEFPEARVIHIYRDGRETAISMSRHYIFRLVATNMLAMRSYGFDAMKSLARGKYWERLSFRLEPLAMVLLNPERLPYDTLTLPYFGTLWSALIERGERMLDRFPSKRLLNLRFEDVQAEPEHHIRRLIRFIDPALEDEAWLREVCAIPRPTPSKFERLEAAERDALTEACRPGLERLGYPLSSRRRSASTRARLMPKS